MHNPDLRHPVIDMATFWIVIGILGSLVALGALGMWCLAWLLAYSD